MNRLCKQHGEGTGMCKKHGGGKLCYYIVVTEGKAVAATNKLSNDTSDSLHFYLLLRALLHRLSVLLCKLPLLLQCAIVLKESLLGNERRIGWQAKQISRRKMITE